MSARARAQRDAECDAERMKEKMAEHAIKHFRRLKYECHLRNPKHRVGDYDEEPTSSITDTSSADFRKLPSLERIRILRKQSGFSRPKDDAASNEWTKDEIALLNQSLYPERQKRQEPQDKHNTKPPEASQPEASRTPSVCLSEQAKEEWSRNAQQMAEWHKRMDAEIKKLGLK